jgi:polysaccharide biosynthesis transport protein
MGSMVPLEVSAARDERPPPSEPDSFQRQAGLVPEILPVRTTAPTAAPDPLVYHDVLGWQPPLDPAALGVTGLRDAVLKQASAQRLCIVVTGSADPNRATVAAALAISLAQNGARVLLVEADFDRPGLDQALAVPAPSGAGFSQQLRARQPDGPLQPWVVLRCMANLNVLVEGRLRSPGLLASGMFERAIHELGGYHHVVVIHAAPLNRPSDLRPLSALSQAVVIANAAQQPTIQFGDGVLRSLL